LNKSKHYISVKYYLGNVSLATFAKNKLIFQDITMPTIFVFNSVRLGSTDCAILGRNTVSFRNILDSNTNCPYCQAMASIELVHELYVLRKRGFAIGLDACNI